ncbi:hypothetical protein [Succinimonas sp.]|uniref:hypothetical protein n=1 Tax=Succinimonas sp. TaxID=1936151 RepID=UPI00386E95DC
MKNANNTVRIASAAIKTSRDAVRYARDEISGTEFAKRTAKTAASTAASAGGAWAGAAIGSAICPGIGTAAGAVVGGLVSGLGLSSLFD